MLPTDSAAAKPIEMTDSNSEPSLWRDPAYHGMNVTQFLGAFNDNLFKQLVLLLCVDYAREQVSGGGRDYQTLAGLLFALPFVLFSGFAGFLADRISKQRIVVAMKIAEIGVMAAGFLAFHTAVGRLGWLFVVVFFMGTHSAFFGPAKYGILPELFRRRDLPQVNGMIQMTTFLSIIFGMSLAGFIKEWFGARLWIGSAVCVGIAIAGTLTSLLVRRTPVAHPGLPFNRSALFLSGDTWRMIRYDPPLLQALAASTFFWFLGGVVQFLVNAFGKLQLHYGDGRTSVMAACMAIGIMVGCLWAGKASRGRIRFEFVTLGAWGMIVCLLGLAALGAWHGQQPVARAGKTSPSLQSAPATGSAAVVERGADREKLDVSPQPESFFAMLVPRNATEWVARGLLVGIGLFAGFFVVPLAVFMQVRPPDEQKGRMIGAMNLFNWIGILVAAVFYGAIDFLFDWAQIPRSWIFAVCAAVMLPVALLYRPAREQDMDWS